MTVALLETDLPDLKLLHKGKVRDVYDVDEKSLLFVATDRLSAFDVVMKNGIPHKGKVLTQLSMYWFKMLDEAGLAHHVITANIDEMPEKVRKYKVQLEGRTMLVKKLEMLPIEAIVRGYITGSGWKDYLKTGALCGITLPVGLKECERLVEPILTPSTKAEVGGHDENITSEKAAELVGGKELYERMESMALKVYSMARDYAGARGVLIADTKFEFGLDESGHLVFGDEVLTPDSSRFWPADKYVVGQTQESLDKQYIRNYLEEINFDKTNPIEIPADIISKAAMKYFELYTAITGSQIHL
eukprot:Clim_evm42s229 gene=Clim_evmTU42s229